MDIFEGVPVIVHHVDVDSHYGLLDWSDSGGESGKMGLFSVYIDFSKIEGIVR